MRAFITGLTGQDGHYLSKLLLSKGYEVYGLVRRTSQPKQVPDVNVIEGDVTDPGIGNIIKKINPDEVYNLAAMSHVGESFKIPRTTFEINALGTLNILEAVKHTHSRFYQASTSELFGNSPPPQSEKTTFYPRSPYGAAKLASYWLTVNYRESYGLFACNGILFNHESPLRGKDFVTRKVCDGVAEIVQGKRSHITLGNLDAKRDWGHAEDFVYGMWLMLQQDMPDDFVLATGETRSIRDLLDAAFGYVGIQDWSPYVKTDKAFYRPADVDCLIGDATKAKTKLGWEPKHTFQSMIGEMIDHALSV
jgi:GDPmannose 4,6-dehydratase